MTKWISIALALSCLAVHAQDAIDPTLPQPGEGPAAFVKRTEAARRESHNRVRLQRLDREDAQRAIDVKNAPPELPK